MADCPGVLHLALMADGALARLRTPGGELTAAQIRTVAEAAAGLGSGIVDLTNRANLQIRGLSRDAGPALAGLLVAVGLAVEGEADRRRNILLDPYSGLDPDEIRDMRPLARALDEALRAAPWIGGLSPKFAFALDGGGASGVGATPSDVLALATPQGLAIHAGSFAAFMPSDDRALAVLTALARAAAAAGPDSRARDLDPATIMGALGLIAEGAPAGPAEVAPRYSDLPTADNLFAVTFAVPVGRLDVAMLRFLADAAEREGDATVRLAPWSAVVMPGVSPERAEALRERADRAGFLPASVAANLAVVACAGAPACERAREPAKALAAELLAAVARDPAAIPRRPTRVHLSACPKGCAGSRPADLLLLGASDAAGWSVHRDAAPRAPGRALGRLDGPTAADMLALVALGN